MDAVVSPMVVPSEGVGGRTCGGEDPHEHGQRARAGTSIEEAACQEEDQAGFRPWSAPSRKPNRRGGRCAMPR